jgi:molecular chaperone GrpE
MAEDAAVPDPQTPDSETPDPETFNPETFNPGTFNPRTLDEQAAREAQAAQAEAADALLEEKLQDQRMRAAADLDNARKRHARELGREVEAERRRVCLAWLPVVDNLELALEHAGQDDPVVAGVQAVRAQAVTLLESLGYERDDEVGEPFDPVRHEVVSVLDDPSVPPGTVVKVLRPGYGRAPDRQLRAAAVVVSRMPE